MPRGSRKGRSSRYDGTAIPTDIRYKALIGKEKHVHEGTEKEHHYTDALIKRAIT